jgi:hypothetical protein
MSYKLEATRKSFERLKRKNKNLSATIYWPTKGNCQRIKEKGKFL